MKKIKLIETLAVLLILLFLVIEISSVKLPGPYCDEAGVGCDALIIKQGIADKHFIETAVKTPNPFLMRNYHGALDAYIIVLLFYLFPIGIVSMRLTAILFGALTIVLTYSFTKEFFNKYYALLAILLLVINPGFIMGTKLGVDNAAIMAAIYMAVLFFLLKWYRQKKDLCFCLAMFLLGLGMWTRIWFLWFVFGLCLTAVVFRNHLKQSLAINKPGRFFKYLILGGILFCLGCSVIIYHELIFPLSIFKLVLSSSKDYSLGHKSFQYLHNFLVVIRNFRHILSGRFYFAQQFQECGDEFITNLYPWTFLFSIIYLFIFAGLKKNFPYRRNILFILILFIGMFMLTPISISHLPWYHLYFFFPFPQLIIAVAVVNSIQSFKKVKIILMVIIIFSVSLIVKEVDGLRGYFYYLRKTGGKLYFSPVIYDLTKYLLEERGQQEIILGSWGLHSVIDVVSGGRIHTTEHWFIKDLEPFLRDSNNLFIFYPKGSVNDSNDLKDTIASAKRLNLVFVEKKRFYERDGSLFCVIMGQGRN